MTSALTGHVKVGGTFPLYFSGNTTMSANEFDRVFFIGSSATTLVLPSLASSFNGYELRIRNSGTATLTVQGSGSDLIGASNTATLTANQSLLILVDHVRSKWQLEFGPA